MKLIKAAINFIATNPIFKVLSFFIGSNQAIKMGNYFLQSGVHQDWAPYPIMLALLALFPISIYVVYHGMLEFERILITFKRS